MVLEITIDGPPPATAFTKDSVSPNKTSARTYADHNIEQHLRTLQDIANDDFRNEEAILALPRRKPKMQRPLATTLAQQQYPDKTEVAAIIEYDRQVHHGRSNVRKTQRKRMEESLKPRDNAGGRLLKLQGPWAGQEIDPVNLKGSAAIPMPVKIGSADDFKPVFNFLKQNKPITEADESQATHGLELIRNVPLVEFERGIVYEDGRLDLCKKVVGPTHIGALMRSLESNTYITHFLLGNNVISATGAQCIADFIDKHPNRMETWYLAGCHITRHGLSVLVPKMSKSTSITNLWFKRNPFGAESASLLANLVFSTKNLRTLDLETTELGDEGTRQFIDGIVGKPTSLFHLYLNANGIGENACASLGKYLADPHCQLESLFLSSNPIGDAGATHLAAGIEKNTSLERLMLASAGLTNKGVASIAQALVNSPCNLQCLDLSVSQTTKAHSQRFNYLHDGCISDLNLLIMKPSLRALHLGRCVFTPSGLQSIRDAASHSELVYLDVQRVDIGEEKSKSCSLALRTQMAKNQEKYFPHIEEYSNFLNSEEFRYLRNTSDVRKIDSMYRTLDKRLGLPMDEPWEVDDPVWRLITEDAFRAEGSV